MVQEMLQALACSIELRMKAGSWNSMKIFIHILVLAQLPPSETMSHFFITQYRTQNDENVALFR